MARSVPAQEEYLPLNESTSETDGNNTPKTCFIFLKGSGLAQNNDVPGLATLLLLLGGSATLRQTGNFKNMAGGCAVIQDDVCFSGARIVVSDVRY
jgi:hypothetical protein